MIAILAVLVIVAAFVLITAIVAGTVLTTRRGQVVQSTGELEGEDWPDYGDESP